MHVHVHVQQLKFIQHYTFEGNRKTLTCIFTPNRKEIREFRQKL